MTLAFECCDDDPEARLVEGLEVMPDLEKSAREPAVDVGEGLAGHAWGRSASPAATSRTDERSQPHGPEVGGISGRVDLDDVDRSDVGVAAGGERGCE